MNGNDRGSVTAFLAISVVGLLALAGLVVDGGAKVRAAQRADRLAAEAGRTAGQQIDLPDAIVGAVVRVDPLAAQSAARLYLHRAGVEGAVTISADRRFLVIHVTTSQPTAFLSLVGLSRITASGTAEVELVHAVIRAAP
jgi:hypothetical protein